MAVTALTEDLLLNALARGSTVVLPNRRAARMLRETFDELQRSAGLHAWESPTVLAWTDWTHRLWSALNVEGKELRLLLNSAQEHSLWREIIAASTAGRTLSSPDALAEMARSAWALADAHLATGRIRTTANTFDSRTFAGWAESFVRITAGERCVSTAMLESALSEHARAGDIETACEVAIAGFEELSPAQRALLDALGASGAKITEGPIEPGPSIGKLRVSTIVPSAREELIFAARWIRTLFEDHVRHGTIPRIAVLLAQPQDRRAEIEAVFREILAPELQPVGADISTAPWEFAGGTPLSTQPMIVDALALLRLVQGPLAIERLGALLQSPFIGADSDRLAAARFDAQVLRRGPYLVPELDLEGLRRLLRIQSHSTKPYRPSWLEPLNDLHTAKARPSRTRTYAEWAELMREILRTANWPGERAQTASEFATTRAWDGTLDLLATLDFRGPRIDFATAMKALEHLLKSAHVTSAPCRAPVQIMRPEDAEGSIYDAVLLLHATDDAWPEPARLHPLLGWLLQRELGIPGADAESDAARALAHADSLIRRSARVLALSAAADDRGALRPSPLLQQLGMKAVAADELLSPACSAPPIAEDIVPDDVALAPLPSPDLRGGASVLKLQAACGFLAFAEVRLRAAAVDACELGLDPGERGSLVHRALESFWSNTGSQAELRSLTLQERNRRLDEAISAAFQKFAPPAAGWSSSYVGVQRERLRRLLSSWLDFELQRGPFTVQRREERRSISIGPLQLKVQPDRIDEVEGGVVLVDYKTGHSAHPSHWLGDRPDDPQLPLYALLTEPGKLQALLFGRIRPGSEMRWQGLAVNQSILPSAQRQKFVDLELRRHEWETVLTRLAEDFAAGRAAVDPKSFEVNCKGCAQRLLCRVNPSALNADVVDEAEEEIDV